MDQKRRISIYKIKKILKMFAEDITATTVSKILNINRNTINRYYQIFRIKIYEIENIKKEATVGEFETDESYFGAKRVRGKRGRGAGKKIPVFGILKRGETVFVEPISNASKKVILPIIKSKAAKGSIIYTDCWKAYDGLILDGYKHKRIKHSDNIFAVGKNHINGIESFWSFAKRRMSKFNGILSRNFIIHLKECEFRFNNRNKKIYTLLVKMLNLR